MLHRMGYRFTVNGPKNRCLPGKPDIVLPKHKTVVFVHGCFWHRHKGCKDASVPKTRTDWWLKKLDGNVARDLRNQSLLKKAGWMILIVWECESKQCPDYLECVISRGLKRRAY
jgi:DNA mismatch endonuclease (patch repair protein)